MEFLQSLEWWEKAIVGAVFIAGVVVVFWLYYRGKP